MTKTYCVNYTETAYGTMYVEASSPEEALKMLEEGGGECDVVDYDNFQIDWDVLTDEDNKEVSYDWDDVEVWKEAYSTQWAYLKEEQGDFFEKWMDKHPRIGDPEYAVREEIVNRIEKEAVRYANEQVVLVKDPVGNSNDIGC
jgi:hypothetical protein